MSAKCCLIHLGLNVLICHLISIRIYIIKIKWSHDRVAFIMEIHISGKTVFELKWGPEDIQVSIWAIIIINIILQIQLLHVHW